MTRSAVPSSRLRDETGSVLVLVAALSAAIFLLMAALVVDVGNARQTSRNYQNAADAAALAGAQELKLGESQRAVQYAAIYAFQTLLGNPGPAQPGCLSGAGDPAAGYSTCYEAEGVRVHIKTPSNDPIGNGTPIPMGDERQIKVMVCGDVHADFFSFAKKVPFFFHPCRIATATAFSANPCALCVLDESSGNAFELSGTGNASVTGSSVWVNSSAGQAATNSGWLFNAPEFYVRGGASGFVPMPATGASKIDDPIAWLPDPRSLQAPWQDWTTLPLYNDLTLECANPGDTVTIPYGIYPSIKVIPKGPRTCDGTNTIRLTPGPYVIRHEFLITTDANIVADLPGVTIYFACDSFPENECGAGEAPAIFKHSGNGSLTLHASTTPQGHPYNNLLFFFDRRIAWDSSEWNLFSGAASIVGTIYGPTAHFELSGSGDYNSLFVADEVKFTGSGLLDIQYNPIENVPTYLPALIT